MSLKSVSIVIPVCNMVGYTQLCVDYIEKNTTVPYELVFVDNASIDGTPEYLKGLTGRMDVHVIRNERNLGPIVAANQGAAAAKSEYICNMHNDVVIFERGWLSKILAVFEGDGKVGLIGLAGRQRINKSCGVDETTLKHNLLNNPEELVPAMSEETAPAAVLDGMCILARRRFIDIVGMYDKSYGYMHFYDMDYCLRSIEAGFKNMVVNVRAMHIRNGGITRRSVYYKEFVKSDDALYKVNSKIFKKKWRHLLPVDIK